MKIFRSKWLAAFALVGLLAGSSQQAMAAAPTASSSGDTPKAFDLVIMRPLGVGVTALGTLSMIVILPLTLVTRPTEMNVPIDTFVKRPFRYTFLDPLGSH